MTGFFPSRCADENSVTNGHTRWWIVGLIVCLIALLTGRAMADNPPQIVRIEEDWVVEVTAPDVDESSPQIITAMSSTNQLADVHALFELNHRTLPEYHAGGMSLQLWSGDTNLDAHPAPESGALHHDHETIYYTMCMELSGGEVEFEVRDGHSTTWGDFGGEGYLKTSAPTTQSSLSLYSPDVSVANSRVGFAKHRVERFGILRVRYYTHNNELVWVDWTDRTVHELPSGN